MKTKLISNPIFPINLEVCYCKTGEEMKKQIELYKIDKDQCPDLGFAGRFIEDIEKNICFLLLLDDGLDTICHESVHIATLLMDKCGIPITLENDEVLAFLTEYYFRNIRLIFEDKAI